MPGAGRVVPEIEHDDIREVFVGSYRIVYWVRQKTVDVLTVFEGHRLLRSADSADLDQGDEANS